MVGVAYEHDIRVGKYFAVLDRGSVNGAEHLRSCSDLKFVVSMNSWNAPKWIRALRRTLARVSFFDAARLHLLECVLLATQTEVSAQPSVYPSTKKFRNQCLRRWRVTPQLCFSRPGLPDGNSKVPIMQVAPAKLSVSSSSTAGRTLLLAPSAATSRSH